ncbi:MAG: outer membrane protein assembly factor BamA [Woeseiaceae bacterium]|jgi:outer membrane protein insertion porin family|nr:outer membrane protein assembly factor BamA [Woeseiaceae bacterium]MDG1016574.1 outer membrane protein assembly factor BamA [Woeseiaceae bacterium]MDG1865200.1 outer membrane protein assembly factor BamA [Woeseiaceae bacterium]
MKLNNKNIIIKLTLFAWVLIGIPVNTLFAEEFVVSDMRVEGLRRISEGTVFNYLPINVGDNVDETRIQEAIKSLYSEGLFDDISVKREGKVLVVVVVERPSIEAFSIDGNKDIKTEDLMVSLRNVGMSRGRTFDRSVLENVTMFLREQYYDRGKYGVRIKADVEDRPNNTVRISVDVKEGDRAKIRQVNIIGNDSFQEDEIQEDFELGTANWLSWIRQDDRYSKESLTGDLEKLRSFYMDRGYADFRVESTQVAISPNKKDMFVTITIHEGERYNLSEIKLVGNNVIPDEDLERLIISQTGDMFNLQTLTNTSEMMSFRLGEEGYANAEIEPVPELNYDSKEVAVTFYIDPGSRMYVRRINFNGIKEVDDEVFRREVRQNEGAFVSNILIDRSKIRLQRLPFIEEVEVENNPVAGSPDLIDVDFDLKYRMPGQFSGGIGYSDFFKLNINGSITHTNFLGTGERVALQANSSKYSKQVTAAHTDYYTTMNGIRRTTSLNYRDYKQFTSAASALSTTSGGATLDFGYPLGEYQTVSMGLNLQQVEMLSSRYSTQQAIDWVGNNGKSYDAGNGFTGTKFGNIELLAGWIYDSRNRTIFPDRGTKHQFFATFTLPGSEVEYWTTRYNFTRYQPIYGRWTGLWNAQLGYGQALGDTTALPPFKQFHSGGPKSTRGFKESWLGPRDTNGRPYGGNVLVASQFELIIPMPDKFSKQARASLFYDIGNVFNTGEIVFFDKEGEPVEYTTSFGDLKKSVGIAVQWLAPMGLFRFSYAYPLNRYEGTEKFYKDEIERFQFSIGQSF